MNILEEAAATLETGHWCTGSIKDGDKFCAVGAIGFHMGLYTMETTRNEVNDGPDVYSAVRAHPAGKALADEVIKSDWYHDAKAEWNEELDGEFWIDSYYIAEQWDDVIVEFNDAQESAEPVIELFKHAAKQLDS